MELEEIKARTTVVVPVKNEARTLAEVLHDASPYCSELLVVDGHSEDDSWALAVSAGAKCILDNGKGKGDALRCAISHISKDVVVFIDGDGSHDPRDIPSLVTPILNGQADHVTGSRLVGGSSELHGGFDEFLRLAGSSFITACINTRFRVRLSDSQNGFRAIRSEVLRQLKLQENTTTIEQEMIMKTLKLGFSMAEVPTHEYPRRFGCSNIRVGRVWPSYGLSLIKGLYF